MWTPGRSSVQGANRTARLLGVGLLTLGLAACQSPESQHRSDLHAAEQYLSEARELIENSASDAAAQSLRRALDADPFNGKALNNLGVLALQEGDLSAAAESFERAARLLPNDARPLVNLGITLAEAGRVAEATKAFEQAMERDPRSDQARQGLALQENRLRQNRAIP